MLILKNLGHTITQSPMMYASTLAVSAVVVTAMVFPVILPPAPPQPPPPGVVPPAPPPGPPPPPAPAPYVLQNLLQCGPTPRDENRGTTSCEADFNAWRAALGLGLPALASSPASQTAAHNHCLDMIVTGNVSLVDSSGRNSMAQLINAGIASVDEEAEIVVGGCFGVNATADILDALDTNVLTRNVIRSANWTHVGIDVHYSLTFNTNYWVFFFTTNPT